MVSLETSLGTVKIKLYDETPQHKSNFMNLVKQGFYDGVLFHRVIQDFMIQTGDPDSKTARTGQALGTGGPGYTVPAEINSSLYHKNGAIAAARQGDEFNPARASSGSQFYIVQGQLYTEAQLRSMTSKGVHAPFTAAQVSSYTTVGGVPHLDDQYTVFGEVVEGMDVIDKIAAVPTDGRNRPVTDVKILKATLVE
jgi:peptidyl-prolyl cis-trans isomerase B (cyclophilin B)